MGSDAFRGREAETRLCPHPAASPGHRRARRGNLRARSQQPRQIDGAFNYRARCDHDRERRSSPGARGLPQSAKSCSSWAKAEIAPPGPQGPAQAMAENLGARTIRSVTRFSKTCDSSGFSSQGPAYSGIQVIALRSYLKPFALLSASLLEFITRYHLLLSLLVT